MHSPGPWKATSEVNEGTYGPEKYYQVRDANGKIVCDTVNSEVAVIHEISDEDGGVHRWDDQGRINTNLIASVHDLLEACEMAYRSARVVHGPHSDMCVRLENVISRAKGE